MIFEEPIKTEGYGIEISRAKNEYGQEFLLIVFKDTVHDEALSAVKIPFAMAPGQGASAVCRDRGGDKMTRAEKIAEAKRDYDVAGRTWDEADRVWVEADRARAEADLVYNKACRAWIKATCTWTKANRARDEAADAYGKAERAWVKEIENAEDDE